MTSLTAAFCEIVVASSGKPQKAEAAPHHQPWVQLKLLNREVGYDRCNCKKGAEHCASNSAALCTVYFRGNVLWHNRVRFLAAAASLLVAFHVADAALPSLAMHSLATKQPTALLLSRQQEAMMKIKFMTQAARAARAP